jgi:hypothetical protein
MIIMKMEMMKRNRKMTENMRKSNKQTYAMNLDHLE